VYLRRVDCPWVVALLLLSELAFLGLMYPLLSELGFLGLED